MGRPKKIIDISSGKIGKENIKNRQEAEKKLKAERNDLIAPDWLSDNAKIEFERVVSECDKINILDNLDLGVLAIYCNAYDGYVETTKKLEVEGLVKTKMTKTGILEFINPLVNVQEKYVKYIMQSSSKLGLATTDRLKLVVPVKEEKPENKFITMLKERQA